MAKSSGSRDRHQRFRHRLAGCELLPQPASTMGAVRSAAARAEGVPVRMSGASLDSELL